MTDLSFKNWCANDESIDISFQGNDIKCNTQSLYNQMIRACNTAYTSSICINSG